MAATAVLNTVTVLDANLKQTYAKEIEDLKPGGLMLQKDIAFQPKAVRPGNFFNAPVCLAHEQGVTYAAAGTSSSSPGAFTLMAAVAGVYKNAQVNGTQMVLRSQIDYETAARASNAGQRAFRNAFQLVFENMVDSISKRLEIDLMSGTMGIGKVETANSTTNVFTVYAADWAAGFWAAQEGAYLQFYSGTATTGDQRDQSDAVTESYITAVDIENRSITVNDLPSDVVAGDFVYFNTARAAGDNSTHNSFYGLEYILQNTGSLWGISASTYSLWKPSSLNVGGDSLAFQDVNILCAKMAAKGLGQGRLRLYCSPISWANLLDEEVGNRRWMGAGKPKYEVGAEAITFYSQTGPIDIVASNYVKQGLAYCIAPKNFKRVGATDITFNLPGRGDEFFKHLEDKAGVETRCYSNQALFTATPGTSGIITGIVNIEN